MLSVQGKIVAHFRAKRHQPLLDIDLILFRARKPARVLKGIFPLLPFSVGLDRFRSVGHIFMGDPLVVLRRPTLPFD